MSPVAVSAFAVSPPAINSRRAARAGCQSRLRLLRKGVVDMSSWTAIVTCLALVLYLVHAIRVTLARGRYIPVLTSMNLHSLPESPQDNANSQWLPSLHVHQHPPQDARFWLLHDQASRGSYCPKSANR